MASEEELEQRFLLLLTQLRSVSEDVEKVGSELSAARAARIRELEERIKREEEENDHDKPNPE